MCYVNYPAHNGYISTLDVPIHDKPTYLLT